MFAIRLQIIVLYFTLIFIFCYTSHEGFSAKEEVPILRQICLNIAQIMSVSLGAQYICRNIW